MSPLFSASLAVEALVNAVGSRMVPDWRKFEGLRPHEKIDLLVIQLGVFRDATKEPWTTLQYLGGFRNDIAHPKPEEIVKESVLPQAGITKTTFDTPLSVLEREITLGNAKRTHAAVHKLKGLLTDALPAEARFGIYADMWHGSTSAA